MEKKYFVLVISPEMKRLMALQDFKKAAGLSDEADFEAVVAAVKETFDDIERKRIVSGPQAAA